MDIRVLNYFLVAAREENITRAAQLLHITQPTLSRQLMQLEEELGVKLFQRSNHSVALTDEGLLFRRRAQELVNLADRAKNEIIQDKDSLTGIIAIGCREMLSVKELARLMAVFQLQFPRVKFEVYSGSNEDIQERLEQGILDMGLFLEPFNVSKYDVIRMKTREQWGVLVHEESSLAIQEAIHPGDLVGTLVVTVHQNTPAQYELAEWSGDFAREMDFCVHYNVLHNAVIVARERKGVVICLKLDSYYEHMKFLPFKPKLEFGAVIAWKEGQKYSKATKAFIKFLKQHYEK